MHKYSRPDHKICRIVTSKNYRVVSRPTPFPPQNCRVPPPLSLPLPPIWTLSGGPWSAKIERVAPKNGHFRTGYLSTFLWVYSRYPIWITVSRVIMCLTVIWYTVDKRRSEYGSSIRRSWQYGFCEEGERNERTSQTISMGDC